MSLTEVLLFGFVEVYPERSRRVVLFNALFSIEHIKIILAKSMLCLNLGAVI